MNKIKIISIFVLITSLLTSSIFVSCSDDDRGNLNESKLDLSKKVLKFDEVKLISQRISEYQMEVSTNRIDSRTIEQEMQVLLEPFVNNGEILHTEMINYLEDSGEFDNLTPAEQAELLNLDEKQLAELSFAMSTAYDPQMMRMDPRIRACLSAAIGITAIYDLISNTAALGTVETTIGALRLIGRRYLGWIGVGLMVMDFADCYYGN